MSRLVARGAIFFSISLFLIAAATVVTAQVLRSDAAEIAFIRQVHGERTRADIYLMDVGQRRVMPFVTGVSAADLAWSPDGESLAFVGAFAPDAPMQIYLIAATGGAARRLTVGEAFAPGGIVWSPDGSQIAFVGRGYGNSELYTINMVSETIHRLTTNPVGDQDVAWSPDGQRLVFASDRAGNFELYTLAAEGGIPQRVLQHTPHDRAPAWSPDGARLAFTAPPYHWNEVFILEPRSGSVRQLTNGNRHKFMPRWSPDGAQLAYLIEGQPRTIGVMADDGALRTLDLPGIVGQFIWSGDGQWLVFNSAVQRGGQRDHDLFIVRTDGSALTRLSATRADDLVPVWRPRTRPK